MVAGAALTGAVVAASASPALAHYCRRTDFNQTAAANASKSQAWMTAAEYEQQVLPFIAGFCSSAAAQIQIILDAADNQTLFMGPGLLAGGTIDKGGKTSEHFAWMGDAFANC